MIEKKALTSIAINEQLASRWSGRAFDADRQIEQEKIRALLEAARWAPSCYGDEPWRYVLCDKSGNEPAWRRAFTCLAEGNQAWAINAPLLILACANSILTKNGKPNRWGQYDTGAAGMSLCVQATEMGLMVHQMGGFNADKARTAFNVPEQFTPMAMMAVGYQLAEDALPDDIRERELAPRHRSELETLFFNGTWDTPVEIYDI